MIFTQGGKFMCNNKRIIKACLTDNKEIKDYKKTMEDAFIKYLRTFIKSKPVPKNNVFQ